jgi:hypothetical protein
VYGGKESRIPGFCGGNLRGKTLIRPRRRWNDNIKIYLQDVGCGGIDWIELAQERDRWRPLDAAMILPVP